MRTLDKDTTAALPARLKLSRKAYARYFARSRAQEWPLYAGTFLPWERREAFAFLRSGAPHWLRVQEHLEHGCLCPSQVADARAGLVATFASLAAHGERTLPVVKIHHEPLHLLPTRLQCDGARLASASIFFATQETRQAGCWSDFNPLPVDCLVPDERQCQAALDRLSPFAWQALAISLDLLGGRFEPGLHRVAVPHEIAWNAF